MSTAAVSTPSSTLACTSFTDLVSVPHRERHGTKCRAAMPSYQLTSDEHVNFISAKKCSPKQTQKKANKTVTPKEKRGKLKNDASCSKKCNVCFVAYGDKADIRSADDWLKCSGCQLWFHESCAQANGVLDDDDTYTCIQCVD